VGGLSAPGLNPAGPKFLSTAFCHSPESMNSCSAAVTFLQKATSSCLNPTPYSKAENGLPITESVPLLAPWDANPARIASSLVYASTAPALRASTQRVAEAYSCRLILGFAYWDSRESIYKEGESSVVRSGARRPVRPTAACRSAASARISSGAARLWAANQSSPRGPASTRRQ